jgi:hypothetical protein
MVAKLSSLSTRSEASRATSVPPRPHGDTDVRAAQGRCVVHAIAGHRDEVAGLLRDLHQLELLRRRHPCEHGHRVERGPQPRPRVALEFLAGQHVPRAVPDVEVAGDGEGGERVVAGDHHDPDAGLPAAPDRLARTRAQRIDQAEQSQVVEIARLGRGLRRTQPPRQPTARQCQHAAAAGRQAGGGLEHGGPRRPIATTHVEHALRRALDRHPGAAIGRVKARREAMFRLEGNQSDPRPLEQQRIAAQAGLAAEREQRDVRRIAPPAPAVLLLDEVGLVAGDRDLEQCTQGGVLAGRLGGGRVRHDLALRIVPGAGDLEGTAVGEFHRPHGELVAGQRAGLVAGHQRAAAEALDRRQPADDGPAVRHAARADGERHRERHRQSLRNGRDR